MYFGSDENMLSLKHELHTLAALVWAGLLVIAALIGFVWSWNVALQWLIQTATIWLIVMLQSYSRLDLNRPSPSEPLYRNIGWANRLTILRGALIAATGGFLFQDWPPSWLMWLPGAFYTLAAVIDRIDGFVARRSGQTSLLGKELDTIFDALGLAVAPLLAVCYGQIHWSYLFFSSAYYLFQWGIYRRKKLGQHIYTLPPNRLRRAWAGFQMGFIGIVLLPLFTPPVTVVAGFAFMLPVMIGFTIDWLIVSGRIDRQRSDTAMIFTCIENSIQTIFQLALRCTLAVTLIWTVRQPDSLFEYGMLLTACLLLAGVAGRIAALVLIGLQGFYYLIHPFDIVASIVLISAIWLLLLGTGRYSLWRRDEDWVNRYDGG